jgi:hypothetical protein
VGNKQMSNVIKTHGIICVFAGKFNPSIFHPILLENNEVIADAKLADLQVVSPQLTSFSIEEIVIQITPDQIMFECNSANKFVRLVDVICGILKIVEQTPIKAFTLNINKHFQLGKKENVSEFFSKFVNTGSFEDLVTKPIVRSLVLHEETSGAFPVRMIRVEPSLVFPPGLFFDISNYYQDADSINSIKAFNAVNGDLINLISKADEIIDKLLSKGLPNAN